MKPGYYEVEFNATALASGVYFYRIIAAPPGGQAGYPSAGSGQVPSTSSGQVFIQTKKMILLK